MPSATDTVTSGRVHSMLPAVKYIEVLRPLKEIRHIKACSDIYPKLLQAEFEMMTSEVTAK